MEKVVIKGFVMMAPYSKTPAFVGCDMSEHGYLMIGPHEFEYSLPADFNPIAAQVSVLEKQLEKATEEHTKTVLRIKGRIQELLCIENNPSVA